MATSPTIRKERLNVRATAEEVQIITAAARQSRRNLSSYLIESACLRAEEQLASQDRFVMSGAEWRKFVHALDQPPRARKRLSKLLNSPSVLERA